MGGEARGEVAEDGEKDRAGGGLQEELPGEASGGAFVENGGWRGKGEVSGGRMGGNEAGGFADFANGGGLGFRTDSEAGEEEIWRERLFFAKA